MPGGAPLLTPSAATRVVAVIGDPVGHSRSPALHNAAYRALGLDWVYVAFPVADGHGADAVRAVSTLGLAGMSVTMPHKRAAAAAVDVRTPTADRLGAVNTVRPTASGLEGDSTDGAGLLGALAGRGVDPAGATVVVLGAGGAAAAAVLALAGAGARIVGVVARREGPAADVAALAGPAGRVATPAAVRDADIVVDASSAGMQAAGAPFGLTIGDFRPGQVVLDMVYDPPRTPLLDAAAAAGADTDNGLAMLVHQAARQVEAFTGLAAPIAEMLAAAGR